MSRLRVSCSSCVPFEILLDDDPTKSAVKLQRWIEEGCSGTDVWNDLVGIGRVCIQDDSCLRGRSLGIRQTDWARIEQVGVNISGKKRQP